MAEIKYEEFWSEIRAINERFEAAHELYLDLNARIMKLKGAPRTNFEKQLQNIRETTNHLGRDRDDIYKRLMVLEVKLAPITCEVCGIDVEPKNGLEKDGKLRNMCKDCINKEVFKEEIPKLRNELKWFSDQMEFVLRDNDHKGGWEDCSNNYFFQKILAEVVELLHLDNENDSKAIVHEACDIANFAMMIAWNNK